MKKIENIAVFDSTGRMVLNLKNPENQVNLYNLNNGSYFVEVTIGKEKLRERILINK